MASIGRPKLSADVHCTCRQCDAEWFVPDWQPYGRQFCGKPCYYAYRRLHPQITKVQPETKVCPTCGTAFLVGGSGRPPRRQIYCGVACSSKPRTAPAHSLRETDRAWLAGLFDGEGSVVKPRPRQIASLRITITNTNLELLERVQSITGCGTLVPHKRYQEHHTPSWNWQVHSDNARELLRQMLPWLIVKREKAQAAIGRRN